MWRRFNLKYELKRVAPLLATASSIMVLKPRAKVLCDQREVQLEEPKPTFEIPELLRRHEEEKAQQYRQREKATIEDLESLSEDDRQALREQDETYFGEQLSDEERETMSSFRAVTLGTMDELPEGQMVNISICDPFDETKFHPTDKILLARYGGQLFALGTFCGFDYTNLTQGVFLGEKIICPTCGSTYDVKNGQVDRGPSMRPVSSFVLQTREEELQIIMPEHVPAFQRRRYVAKNNLDPRVFVILGDSETALAAIDTLRSGFTGRIIVLPMGEFGSFENKDVFNRKFSPIQKNEAYYVEDDFFDRAFVEVIRSSPQMIDLNSNTIQVQGQKPIYFDKMLIAWGHKKVRLQKNYDNVFYLEDRVTHAKVHNELLKAETVAIMGGTFEAYNTASSVRTYLDSIGQYDTKIMLIEEGKSEVQKACGQGISDYLHELLKAQRISVLMNVERLYHKGSNRLTSIEFKKQHQNQTFYIEPDVVICEGGLDNSAHNLQDLLQHSIREDGGSSVNLSFDQKGTPTPDISFSLFPNTTDSPIFGAGSAVAYQSYFQKLRYRANDVKYNIESGFYAAMNMMDKRMYMKNLPMTAMRINDVPIYFVGERSPSFNEIIIQGDTENGKFIGYYVYNEEVVGFVTVGYQNLHLFLWEAMRMFIMPPADKLRRDVDFKEIVKLVLKNRPRIRCTRNEALLQPSIQRAETENEIDRLGDFKGRMKQRFHEENQNQSKKLREAKAKAEKEGVEYVHDFQDMGKKKQRKQPIVPNQVSADQRMREMERNSHNPISKAMSDLQKQFSGGGVYGGSHLPPNAQ